MARSRLIAEINALDQRLAAERGALASQGRARIARLGRGAPRWLLGGRMLAGLAVAGLECPAGVGGRLAPPAGAGARGFLLGGMHLCRLSGGVLALLAARPPGG